MIRRPPRSTLSSSSAASDVYKRQVCDGFDLNPEGDEMRRYCTACLVEADREFEDDLAGSLKIAQFVKAKFEERYGLYWHCAVGNIKQEYFKDFCDLKKDHSFQVYVSSWDNTYVLWRSNYIDNDTVYRPELGI
eukprot:TRINITY_DN2794_c0_g1_i2.p1 TRINITY_DN2794_c0_g1~~TRINITY_DN2794_c0_g1_i2.p1  ORF type:complete len:134 (-),score=43.60 TRINITY_DN2794_c0_g1_i2:372-773(-)